MSDNYITRRPFGISVSIRGRFLKLLRGGKVNGERLWMVAWGDGDNNYLINTLWKRMTIPKFRYCGNAKRIPGTSTFLVENRK